jgi:hypothetical protein
MAITVMSSMRVKAGGEPEDRRVVFHGEYEPFLQRYACFPFPQINNLLVFLASLKSPLVSVAKRTG